MLRKLALLVAVSTLAAAPAAFAKVQYTYAVKFVCGYNPTDIGVTSDSRKAGEPSVKLGNYATEINIVWPEIYIDQTAHVEKNVILLVEKNAPIGREPNVMTPRALDIINLGPLSATMDDCNKIAELVWGAVPNPYLLTIGYMVIQSTHEIDVTAVYTAEACAHWATDVNKPVCTDPAGTPLPISLSIDVEHVPGRKLLLDAAPIPEVVTPAAVQAKPKK